MSWPEIAGWNTDSQVVTSSGSGLQSLTNVQTVSNPASVTRSLRIVQVIESKTPKP